MSPNRTYKKNFLDNVIVRVDFQKIDLDFLESFHKEIKDVFPFQEKNEVLNSMIVALNQKGPETTTRSVWIFHNARKTKKIQISFDHFLIQYKRYVNKEELLSDIDTLFTKFLGYSKIQTVDRIGLRYTNEINLNKIRAKFSWDKYISKELTGSLSFVDNTEAKLARAFSTLTLKFDEADMTFNYGLWNNDFPSESVRKEFTLDYDCHSRFPINIIDKPLRGFIEKYNEYISDLFELSITAAFRRILNEK